MKAIHQKDWTPADGLTLEASALKVVKATAGNKLVVAGPGAGKTELLAQRACFLLQTNHCKFPHKILAISFKRDAAYNLKERVSLRAGSELSNRFDSLTYDSFAKQIVDRFKSALPKEYKIADYYEVCFDQDITDFFEKEDKDFVKTNNQKAILEKFTQTRLPLPFSTKTDKLYQAVWMRALKSGKVTFKMIMRLADLIIESNPKIKSYLQTTYSYIFLDEFQDTTTIQYQFFQSCFLNADNVVTAVGDDKQRIMGWAGALKSVFDDYQKQFAAERVPLTMNFRSAPLLVNVQNSLIKTLLKKTDYATASDMWKGHEGECQIWEFENQDREAAELASSVAKWMREDKINARDICILVKGSLGKYVPELIGALKKNSIEARDESVFQEFLTDEVILYIIHSLYLILATPKLESRKFVFDFLRQTHNEVSDLQLLRLENRLNAFVKKMKVEYKAKGINAEMISKLIQSIYKYGNPERMQSIFPQYRQKTYLKKVLEEFEKILLQYLDSSKGIQEALDRFYGMDTIPIMTVHKSKGLEYHTIIFVGLEDAAFWSFNTQPDEDKSTFFVALSRAKMRVIFTFSKVRDGHKYPAQERKSIAVIFDELSKAGVKTKKIR